MSKVTSVVIVSLLVTVLAPVQAAAQQSRVFVTSTTTDGNIGGLAGADAICNNLAATAGLGGTWVTWLSTSTVDAIDRLQPPTIGPFVRAADPGVVIATDIMDLTDGTLSNAIELDEAGMFATPNDAWTGTNEFGSLALPNCQDWTTSDSLEEGTFGITNQTSIDWTISPPFPCAVSSRLYCFELPAEPSSVVEIPTLNAMTLVLLGGILALAALAILRRLG